MSLCRARGDMDGACRTRRRDGVVVDTHAHLPPALHPRFQSAGYHDDEDVGRGPNAPCAKTSRRRDRIAARIDDAGWQRPPVALRVGRGG